MILKRMLHGLGRYLDPVTADEGRRDEHGNLVWIDQAWEWILAAQDNPDTPQPDWADRPAMSRVTVSSPTLRRPFHRWNRDRPWAGQIKPFNFLLVATLDPISHTLDVDPTRFLLIAPYTNNPDDWTQIEWRNRYDPDGPSYRITTDKMAPPEPRLAVVRSYGDVLHDYRMHPEHKFLGPDHEPCQRATRGVLHRRPVHLLTPPTLIGKEANNLDDVTAGLVTTLDEVLTDYTNPHNDSFRQLVLPVLDRYSGRELAYRVRANRRTIDRIRQGQQPRPRLAADLTHLAVTLARTDLTQAGLLPEDPRMSPVTPHQRGQLLALWRRAHTAGDLDRLPRHPTDP